jgi:choline-sulfatase
VGASRPNILLIIADQLAAEWLPVYGQEVVHAPELSALADEAVLFESAYCPSPLCAPSRAGLLSGRLPSHTGVYDNAAEMPASLPTVAHALRALGYFTCTAGKMHFVGPDQLHGFEERLTTDIYPAGMDWTPDWRLAATEHLPWYHTMESVVTPGPAVAGMQQDYDDEVAFRAVRKVYDLAREGSDRPFFLTVSFSHPHDPWELPPRYWDLYDRDAIGLPAVPRIRFADADPHSRRLREMVGTEELDLSEEQMRTARHAYFAAISYLDDKVGELLGALRAVGLDDDTIVVFTADHGEMLGERGLWYKMCFFEAAARVPLMMRLSGRASRRVSTPVSLLDLAPTLVALAGASDGSGLGDGLDGRSLLGLLGERPDGGPEAVLGEYLAEGVSAPAVMIRRERWKFVACPGDPDQLYDLADDPAELVNLAGHPGRGDIVQEFRDEVARRWDLEDLRRRVLATQSERRAVMRALRQGAHTSWDFVPSVEGSSRYVPSRADLYELQRRARLDAPASPAKPD